VRGEVLARTLENRRLAPRRRANVGALLHHVRELGQLSLERRAGSRLHRDLAKIKRATIDERVLGS
jgi:hypothetical protein